MKPREGSTAHRAIELIRQHGTARSGWLAEQLGITTSTLSGHLNPYTQDGTLVSCLVRVGDERNHQNEYRLAAAGASMEFKIRSDIAGRGPLVREGTIARPSPDLPSALRLEEARAREQPKPTITPKRAAEIATVWPGADPAPSVMGNPITAEVETIEQAPEVATPEACVPGEPLGDAEGGRVEAQETPSSRPAPAAAPAAAATRSAFRCALANDGSLLLMLPNAPALDLCPEDTRALVEYLRKLDELGAPRISAAVPALIGVQAQ